MTEVDYSSKPEEQPWEADYARKPNLPKCWNVLAEPDGQEQQQEPFKSWESAAKPPEAAKPAVCLEPRKPEAPKPRSTLQEDPKKQCVSKAKPAPSQRKQEVPKAKASCTAGEQREQEPSKPWPGQQQKEQDPKKPSPPKSWTPPVHSEQGLTKSWTPSLGEDQESKQLGSPKTWEDGVRGQKHSSTPHSQISAKSWGAAAASLMPSDPLLPRKFNAEPKDVSRSVSTCLCPPGRLELTGEEGIVEWWGKLQLRVPASHFAVPIQVRTAPFLVCLATNASWEATVVAQVPWVLRLTRWKTYMEFRALGSGLAKL